MHLAEATGKRTRGVHGETHSPRRRSGGTSADAGRGLIKKGQRVVQGVHGGLGKVQGVVQKGLAGAQKAQIDLEKAFELAKAGAGILGEDSELGKYLLDLSARADQAHGYLEQGIGSAEQFNKGVGKHPHPHGHGGKDDGSPLHQATYLEGGWGKRKAGGGGHDGTPERLQHGKKVDAQLGKLEHALGKGIQIGKKMDGGLSKIAGVADQLSKALGEDSELGHFGRQISGAAGAGHEKLHDALNLAGKGKRGLHKGRELFEQGLKLAAGHHEEKLEKMYGKKHANAEHEHGGTHDAELVRHLVKGGKKSVHDVQQGVTDLKHGAKDVGSLWGHLKAHDWKGALGDGKNLIGDGKHLWGEAKGLFGGGKKSPHDPTPGPHRKHHHHHHRKHHEPGPQPAPQHGGAGAAGFSEADIAQVVQGAMQWVTSFGKAVTAAVREIEKLMSAGKTREAGDRVQAVSMTSEQTRFEVARAVSTSAKDPGLHKQAQSASKHYLEIRKHFFTFVKGLHGLGGQTTELEGVDSKKYPDLRSLSTGIHSLQVKIDALGEVKHADTPMQGPVGDLKKEASGLRARVSKAQSAHKGDAAALEVVAGLSGKLQQIERHLGAHADKKNSAQGDKDLGIPGGAPRPHRKHKKKHHHRRHRHHGGDPIDDILNGEDGRISVDRGGARGDMDVHDGQDVDPAAADTWIGSGEGVKLFSEVFGAFLPAEGAVVHHHHRGGGSHREPSHGGAGGALHGQLGEGGLDLGGKLERAARSTPLASTWRAASTARAAS